MNFRATDSATTSRHCTLSRHAISAQYLRFAGGGTQWVQGCVGRVAAAVQNVWFAFEHGNGE